MKKIWIGIVLIAACGTGYYFWNRIYNNKTTVTQTTSKVTKGTLISSITATGSITSGNTTNISTKASGTVTRVYVKNGDLIKKNEKILDMTLDSDGIARRSLAWQAYLKAKENTTSVIKNKQDTSIQVWKDKQAILDAQDTADNVEGLTDAEKNQILEAVVQTKLAFDVDAATFSHADSAISAAKISEQAAYLDYQNVSGTIVAPAAGIINNLTLTTGSTLTASSTQSTTSGASLASSQNIGFIRASNNQYQAKVSLTEVDATKVTAGQKVNITMDAHSNKSFTGKVLAIDVSGSSNSGVSSYPATIIMDPTDLPIYPNMSVAATIITNIESDVLLVPTTAIAANNASSTVVLIKNGQTIATTVETGNNNDTQTVIKNGVSEGDEIVTGSSTSAKNSNSTSSFSNTRQGQGQGAIRIPGQGF
ncbi:MAG: hypothetical protein WCL07_02410 [bacterium]